MPRAASTVYFSLFDHGDVLAARPDRLSEVRLQKRVLRRTVEQTIHAVPSLPTLDVLAPHMVDVMVEVLTCIDKPSSVEQVIAVPTIVDFHHRVPLRTVLREPQMVEQLVDVPVPRTALLALCTSATGVAWRQMFASGQGVYWWLPGTQHTSWPPPTGWTASPGRDFNTGQG